MTRNYKELHEQIQNRNYHNLLKLKMEMVELYGSEAAALENIIDNFDYIADPDEQCVFETLMEMLEQ